jgi:hypothetical protein
MTIFERNLEQNLHAALAAKDMSRVCDIYEQGADLIAGVFQQSSGKPSYYFIIRVID